MSHGIRRLALAALLCLLLPAEALAQSGPVAEPSAPPSCGPRAVHHVGNLVVDTLSSEGNLLASDWCKVWNWDHWFKNLQSLAADFLLSDGLHPIFGSVAPGSSFSGGLALDLSWNSSSPAIRYKSSLEAQRSINGSWDVGGLLTMRFVGLRIDRKSPALIVVAKHFDLARLPDYGPGMESAPEDLALYSLRGNVVTGRLDFPLPAGFTLSGWVGGAGYFPGGATDGTTPSLRTSFDETTAPGLRASTSYLIAGGALAWRSRISPALHGFSTDAKVGYAFHGALSGGPYSFGRFETALDLRYSPGTEQRIGTFTLGGRLVSTTARPGNRIPFYLQPTLGGSDLAGASSLRAFEDYRFRGPNLVSYALSFEHDFSVDTYFPFGVIAFGELGKVADRWTGLGFDGLAHSVGGGLNLRLGGVTMAQLTFAWGGEKDPKPGFTGSTYAAASATGFTAMTGMSGVF